MTVIKKIFCTLLIISTVLGCVNISFAEVTAEPEITFRSRLISLEAEDGVFSDEEKIIIEEDANASGGKKVFCTNGAVPSSRIYNVDMTFNMERKGFVYVWVRIKNGTNGYRGAAVYISVNGSKYHYSSDSSAPTETGRYWWVKAPVKFTVEEGENTLSFSFGHMVSFDKAVITTSATYSPSGITDPNWRSYGFDYTDEIGSKDYVSYVEKEHPRLLINEEDIPRIRENLTHPQHKTYYQQFKSAVAAPNSGLGADVNNSDSWSLHQNLEYNALHYLLYRDIDPEAAKSSAQSAINGTINMLDRLSCVEDSHNVLTPIFVAGEVYDWCYDEMSDSQKEKIIRLGIMHMENSFLKWPYTGGDNSIFVSGYGSEQGVMRDFFSFAIAVYDEFPEAYYVLSKHIFESYVPTLNYFYEGQSVNQNGSYYGIVLRMRYELFLKWILNGLGCGNLISPWQENVAMQYAYGRRPDGLLMNDGDDGVGDVGYYHSAPHTAFLAGNLYRNPMLRQEMYRSDLNMNIFAPHYLILNDPTIGLSGYESLPLSNWGGNLRGIMHARTSWDEGRVSSNAMLVNMKMPEKFFKGHEHLDAGGFEIYYKGALALDSGVYGANYGSTFGSAHDYGYNKQTIAHNCMLIYNPESDTTFYSKYPSMGGQVPDTTLHQGIDSYEELTGEKTDYGKILGYDYGDDMNKPEYTYLKGDLTKAYAGKADLYTRTFVFNNFFDDVYPGCLVVMDKVVTSVEGTEKVWLLHGQNAPVKLGDNVVRFSRSDYGYGGRLYNHTLLPKEVDTTTVGGTNKEFYVNGTNYSVTPAHPESGKYRVEISPTTEGETDYFINVLYALDNDYSIPRLYPELLENDTHYGVKIKDRIMYLSKNEERTSDSLTLSIEGDESEYIIQVDALKEGTWQITGESFNITKEVTDNGGVINFKAAPGEYTLTYVNGTFTEKDYNMFSSLDENAADDHVQIKIKNSVGTGNQYEFCDIDAFLKDGVIFAEFERYAKYTGSTVTYNEDGSYTMQTTGTATYDNPDGIYYATFRTGSNEVELCSIYGPLRKYVISPPYEEEGKKYIPILSTAGAIRSNMTYTPAYNLLKVVALTSNVSPANSSVTVNPELDIEYPYFADEDSFYFFGKLDTVEDNPVEYGIAVSTDEDFSNPSFYPFKDEYSEEKQFGIQLKYEKTENPVLYTAFYKKHYGEFVLTGKRALRKSGEAGLEPPVKLPAIEVSRYGYRYANPGYDWDLKVDLTQTGAVYEDIRYYPTTSVVQGTSKRVGMDFPVPEIPEGYEIRSAKLHFYAKTTAEALTTRIYRTTDDWFDGTVSTNWPIIGKEISVEPVAVKNAEYDENGELIASVNGFYKYTFEINPEEIVRGTFLPVTVKYDWIDKKYNLYIMCSDADKLPYLEIEIEKAL